MSAETFINLGYRLEDDCWGADGRETFIHDDNATRDFLLELARDLTPHGWRRDENYLRTFRHANGEIIEVEVGGSNTTGHYLHHLTEKVAKEWLTL